MVLRVARFNPATDKGPRFQEYVIPPGMAEQNTVLSLLQYIYDNVDHTLAYRGPCGRSFCGTCTVRMNGRPGLSCMRRAEGDVMTIEPLSRVPVLRDLACDMQTRKKA
jgi:succinate dehydrogenase/fumarate reductase-like Fe-S protein